jgi:hypothetical protein
MPDPSTDPTLKAAAGAAEAHVFQSLARDLERAGTPEAVLHLRHLLQARLDSVTPEGPLRRVRLRMLHRVSDYTVQLNALTGEQTGWYLAALSQDSTSDFPAAEALAVATKAADVPQNAVLEHFGYEEQGEQPVFVARWAHHENGIPVERDFIHVLVNGANGRPFAYRRRWHALDTKPSWR